jgi:hypothetical protein
MALIKCKECGKEVSSEAKTCPYCGAKPKTKTSLFTWVITVIAGFFVFNAAMNIFFGSHKASSNVSTNSKYESAMQSAKLHTESRKAGFNNVLECDFTLTNDSPYSIKDMEITCTNHGNSLSVVSVNKKTIYDSVETGTSKQFDNINMGIISDQVASTSCTVTNLKVI